MQVTLSTAYERLAERRKDTEWLDEVWADPNARALVIAGTRLRTVDGRPEWVAPRDAPEGRRVLLGELDGVVRVAVLTAPDLADDSWTGLRAVVTKLAAHEVMFVVHAIGIAEWQFAMRHCPRCGSALESSEAGHVLICTGCGRQQFPRTDPAVIMLVTDGERCLLGRHPNWASGRYSTLAGFVEPGESIENAVRREVAEEVGIRIGTVEYVGSQPWPLPASLMLGFIAHADSAEIHVDGNEIEDARWFTREEMLAETTAGTLGLPGGISISRSLVEAWYGGPLAGHW